MMQMISIPKNVRKRADDISVGAGLTRDAPSAISPALFLTFLGMLIICILFPRKSPG